MNDDAELLSRYADEGSEAAFGEVVRRHVNLVYGAALRRTGDPHHAADVAQQVFTALARDARKLARHALLPAWLHTATRNAALNLMISEQRRRAREAEALARAGVTEGSATLDWVRLGPLLDSAIDELPEADRTAVILRFLEHRPFAEIAATLKVSEDAARMRTDRALEKLRPSLARRGITSTASALGAVMLGEPLWAAPVDLAASLSAQAVAAAVAGTITTLMTTKIIVTATAALLLAFGAGTYVGVNRRPATDATSATSTAVASADDDSTARARAAGLREENRRLADQVAGLNTELAQLTDANAQLKKQVKAALPPKNPTLGLAKWETQQMIQSNLRQIDAARKQYKLQHGTMPGSLNDLVGRRNFIRAVRTVGGEDYSSISMEEGAPLSVVTAEGDRFTYDPSGATTTKIDVPPQVTLANQLGEKIQPVMQKAVVAYQAAHNGSAPPNPEALLAYFPTPEEAADYAEYIEAKKAANAIGP